jgi:hypothetical protein
VSRNSSLFLTTDPSDIHFWLRKYAVDKLVTDHHRWPRGGDLCTSVLKSGIPSIEALEAELAHYLEDESWLGATRDHPC